MKSCFQSQITDAGLRLLTNIKYLDISGCNQRSISDTIFVLMPKLNELRIGCCDQFTDAAFQHLSGLKLLDMGLCDQPEITGSGFKYLTNLQSLNMAHCDQITGYNLLYLTKLKELDISHCSQLEYNSLKHLFSVGNIKKLVYTWCFEGQSMPEWFQSYLFN
jgi:Leucine-rich repeat (LRR) protein